MSSEFELEYEEHVSKHFRSFVRFRTLDRGKHQVEKTFKRWWLTKAPTRFSMTNDRGKKENLLPQLKTDVWNKVKEVM